VLSDFDAAKTTFGRVGKMFPGNSEVPEALGLIARREKHWDQSVACFEQALALDRVTWSYSASRHGVTAGIDNSRPH